MRHKCGAILLHKRYKIYIIMIYYWTLVLAPEQYSDDIRVRRTGSQINPDRSSNRPLTQYCTLLLSLLFGTDNTI